MEVVLLVVSFAVILAGALLFTNAIEWIGHRLGLGEGAVGSLLAAVGTALPETLIAIVALVGAHQERGRRDRGDRRRAVPARDAGDGAGRADRLRLPPPARRRGSS